MKMYIPKFIYELLPLLYVIIGVLGFTAPLFNKMFQQIYGCEIVKDMHVISASPSIIAKIKNNEQSTAN